MILAIIRAILLSLSMALYILGYSVTRLFWKHTEASSFALRRNWVRQMGWPLMGLRVAVEGKPSVQPAVYVCNHRSFSDPVILCRHLNAFVIAKAEIASYPIINKGAEVTGIIWVDRGNKDSRTATREKLLETLDRGYNVLVYPEGTVGGQRTIMPYKMGPFAVAAKNGYPVVPVVLEYRDTKDLWYKISLPKQFFRQFGSWRTEAKMAFGEAMYGDDVQDLHDRVEAYTKAKMLEMQEGWTRATFTD